MRVGLVQHDIVWEDRDATLSLLAPRVRLLADEGAQLVVLPEMFAVGFSMATDRIAEDADGPTAAWLREQAMGLGLWIGGSFPVRHAEAVRNRFLLSAPDGSVRSYDKQKPFTYGGEAEHYAAGGETVTWQVEDLRVTPFVCYDLRFAPLWWDRAPATDLFLCVASWPAKRAAHWRSLLVARAIENQAYVLGCNRVGDGGGIAYDGGSLVVDPLGAVVAEAGSGEASLAVDVEACAVADVRSHFPFLADR